MSAPQPKDARFRSRYGPWAVVTGSSSGIGAELARQLAPRGLNLVLVARRRDRLEELARSLRERAGVEVRVVELDLVAEGAVDALVAATADLEVGLLVNNAGFGLKGDFLSIPRAEYRRMIELNCRVPLELAHAFLGPMAERGRGGMVLVASTAAYQGIPYTATYAATKSFDLLLGEALWYELRGRGVDVLTLCPGPTDTEGPRRSGVDVDKVPVKMMHVEPVARAALASLGRRPVVIPGATNRIGQLLVKLLPRSLSTRIVGWSMRRVIS